MNKKGSGLVVIVIFAMMWFIWFVMFAAFDLSHYTLIIVFDEIYDTLNRTASTDAQEFINDYGTVQNTVADGKQIVFFAYTVFLFVATVAFAYQYRGFSR